MCFNYCFCFSLLFVVVVCLLSSMVFVLFIVKKAEVCNEKRLTSSLLSPSTAAGLRSGGQPPKIGILTDQD